MGSVEFDHFRGGKYKITYPDIVELSDYGDYYYGEFEFIIKFLGFPDWMTEENLCAPCGWCNDYEYTYDYYGIYEAYSKFAPELQLFIPKYNLTVTNGAGLVGDKTETSKYKGCDAVKGISFKEETFKAYIKIPKKVVRDFPPDNDKYNVEIQVFGTIYFDFVNEAFEVSGWCARSAKSQGLDKAYHECRMWGSGSTEHHWCDMNIMVVLTKPKPPVETPCPCDLIKQVYPTGDEEITGESLQQLADLGATLDCINYLVNAYFDGKRIAKEALPECYEIPPPKNFEAIVKLDKETVAPRELVIATVTVKNYENRTITLTIDLTYNGTRIGVPKSVTVVPNGTARASWELRFPEVGSYEICPYVVEGGGKVTCATIEVVEKVAPQVTIQIGEPYTDPSPPVEGKEVKVKADVTLTDAKEVDLPVSIEIALYMLNERGRASRITYKLYAFSRVGETITAEFTYEFPSKGKYDIAVAPNGLQGRLWSDVCADKFVIKIEPWHILP